MKQTSRSLRTIGLSIMGIIYLGLLCKYLLTPTVPSFNHVRPFNLMPFRTIAQNLIDGGTPIGHRAYELIGNFLVLAPIGTFLALKMKRFRVWPVVIIGLGISTAVEILQYLLWTWRVADVDDVICNSSGATAAYLITAFVLHRYRPNQYPSLRKSYVIRIGAPPAGLTSGKMVIKLLNWGILRRGSTWASLRSGPARLRVVVVAAFVAIIVVVAITLANSGKTISRLGLCSTRNLSGSASLQGENGYRVGALTLENNGRVPCRLPARPSVVLVWHGATLAIHQIVMAGEQSRLIGGTTISVLPPHAMATVALAWGNWCQTLPSKTYPPSGSLLVSLSRTTSPVRISVKNFLPARYDWSLKPSTLEVGRFRSP